MLWLLISGFFCWLICRETYHGMVPPAGYDRPRPVSTVFIVMMAVLACAFAYPPVSKWHFENYLTRKARILAETDRVDVHCNTVFDMFLDSNSLASGHANLETGQIVFNSNWCGRLRAHLRNPEESGINGIFALHLFAHEAMHIRGERSEARTECQAIQRHARAAVLLGISEDLGRRHGLQYFHGAYQSRSGSGPMSAQYYSPQCGPGKAMDEKLTDSIWR